jgi:hypothetical protein
VFVLADYKVVIFNGEAVENGTIGNHLAGLKDQRSNLKDYIYATPATMF